MICCHIHTLTALIACSSTSSCAQAASKVLRVRGKPGTLALFATLLTLSRVVSRWSSLSSTARPAGPRRWPKLDLGLPPGDS